MYEAFPLHWPVGYKRTRSRITSSFKQNMEAAQTFLRNELGRMGARQLVISTNIPVRKYGGMYTDYMNKKMDDPGVAIYFKYKDKDISMCCDQYLRVWENIYALGKGIEALRGMERWGVSEFLERAFTGFKALPESVTPVAYWWQVLETSVIATIDDVKAAYRRLAAIYHPDNLKTGNAEKFMQINGAYNEALTELNKSK